MFRETLHIFHGAILWGILRLKLQINYKKIVLTLVNENKELDYYALAHLSDYMNRKYADEAVVLYLGEKETSYLIESTLAEYGGAEKKVRLYKCSRGTVEAVYDYYSFHKFFDNIVFTFVSRPRDNMLEKVLKDTQINEEDAVCLGLYRLRMVPSLDKNKRI